MAGAKPEYFPVILALAASQVSARASTTSSAAAMAVVNSPIREEIGMNWSVGTWGPTITRTRRSAGIQPPVTEPAGGPLITYLGSQGNNYAYNSICFAENEAGSPWDPLQVQKGLDRNTGAVSCFSGNRSTSFMLGLRETLGETRSQQASRREPAPRPLPRT